MINIAICDDMSDDRKRLFENINDYFFKANEQVVIELHESGKSLIEATKKKVFDLIFLDIILGDINGINVAEKIRLMNSETSIIFISSSKEFAIDGYSVNAMSYLLKPYETSQLYSLLDKFLTSYTAHEIRSIKIKSEGINIKVPVDKIMYIESQDKKLFFHLFDDSVLDTYAKLDDYNLIMNDFGNFLRCHKSYYINMDYVEMLKDNKFVMKDNTVIPIPKEFISIKKKAYYDYIMEKI